MKKNNKRSVKKAVIGLVITVLIHALLLTLVFILCRNESPADFYAEYGRIDHVKKAHSGRVTCISFTINGVPFFCIPRNGKIDFQNSFFDSVLNDLTELQQNGEQVRIRYKKEGLTRIEGYQVVHIEEAINGTIILDINDHNRQNIGSRIVFSVFITGGCLLGYVGFITEIQFCVAARKKRLPKRKKKG